MNDQEIERLQCKTPEARFLSILEREYDVAPRVARALLEEAVTCLVEASKPLPPGQVRVILARRQATAARSLRDTPTVEVVWTVDAGHEDGQVLLEHGSTALRQVRIQRLLDEAIDQGAVATQEDLAHALHVSVRTIKRDCLELQGEGVYLPTRGNVHGIGRGQTHKARIVGRWLAGETLDQIALHTHHCVSSVQRYVQAFARVMQLHSQGFPEGEIAQLLQISIPLVREYLAVYQQHDSPASRERLEEQLQRLGRASQQRPAPKKGGL
ncbi:MAG: DUF1670 domain-containing protein [Candidatus Oleimicrobiaceae bacterium]